MFLRNTWYVIGFSRELDIGQLAARTVAGEPIVLFRNSLGVISALHDRCPHRFAPLSLGKVVNGTIQCGYHGISFDALGQCTHNPLGPVSKALNVRSYPTEERHGLIWIWYGDDNLLDPSLIPNFWFIDVQPDTSHFSGYIHVKANHHLLTDNILDLTHANHLHLDTLANAALVRPKVREVENSVVAEWISINVPAMPMHQPFLADPEAPVDTYMDTQWFPCGAMRVTNTAAAHGAQRGEGLIAHAAHIFTPETTLTTHYFYAIWRNWAQEDADYNALLASSLRRAFTDEDIPMVEAQQLRIGSDRFETLMPALTPTDEAPTRARRMYKQLMEAQEMA